MKEGDVSAYIDTQLEQFRLLGREDLARQVETVLALVAQGACSADTCYEVFEAAKLQVRELEQQRAWEKRKPKKRSKPATRSVVAPVHKPVVLPLNSAYPMEEGVAEMLREAQDQLRMRILYHVLRVVEIQTRPLHPREKKTSDPRAELASLDRSLADKERRRRQKEELASPLPLQTPVGDDFALSLAKPKKKRVRVPRSKPLERRVDAVAPLPKIVVTRSILYQALIMGTQYCDRADMRIPFHILTRFDATWFKSQSKSKGLF
jgi:hypothetical protein